MLAEIFPTNASYDSSGLTYFVPDFLCEAIRIGQLVEIPYKEEVTYGIVARTAPAPGEIPGEIKSIVSVVSPTPLLSAAQIETIRTVASESVIHLHKVLSLFLPKPVISRVVKYGLEGLSETRKKEGKTTLHFLKDDTDPLSYALDRFEKKGTVFIAPSDAFLGDIDGVWKDAEKLGIYASDFTDTKRAKCWISAKKGDFFTLIWTRRLALYNLDAFERIIYFEDAILPELLHSFHRYDVLELLRSLATRSGQSLDIVSTYPSIRTMSLALASTISLVHAS